MKHYALGWACNLNDIFVRFPYEKCKSLIKKYKDKQQQKSKVKKVFNCGLKLIIQDIIDNNITFEVPKLQYYGGQLHLEAITGEEFMELKKKGKFKGVDFLESNFTGYQMYLYIKGKRDNFLPRRKFPVYFNKVYRDQITKNTNEGKQYC